MIRTGLFAMSGLVAATALLCGCDGHSDSGSGQKAAGHVESAAGSLTGDDHLKREGKKDEVVGGVKGAAHDVKDAVHDATK